EVKSDPLNTVWLSNKKLKPKVGFLFPGQGSQRLNMSCHLVERHPWAQEICAEIDKTLKNWYGSGSFSDLIFRPLHKALNADQVSAWTQLLTNTENAQPAICMSSILWAYRLQEIGIHGHIVGGHSLGELTALSWAGAFDYQKLIELAAERGHQMASKGDATMVSLACNLLMAEEIVSEVNQQAQASQNVSHGNAALKLKAPDVGGDLVIANINGLQQIVISGTTDRIQQALKLASSKGVRATQLNVSNAFHSPLVASAAQRFVQNIKLPLNSPPLKVPFISGVDGKTHFEIQNLKKYLCEQITSPVKFTSVVEEMSQHCDLMIEVGPGAVLTGLAQNFLGKDRTGTVAVESRAEKQGDFSKLVARYFALGGTIHIEKLFAHRLIRPYEKFSQKRFFTNPCEIPFPASVLESIRPSSAKSMSGTAASPEPKITLPASPRAQSQVATASPELSREEVKEILLTTLTQITDFPKDVFKMNMRLLDDLNLDSIKAGEAITQVAATCQLESPLDPIQIANSNLDEIIDIVTAMKPRRNSQVASLAANPVEEPKAQVFPQPVVFPTQATPDSISSSSA
ncbi:MAG: acyltransferase domain-containing protein, partial [Pseudobdellovibrionaceae bacterium]